jgi:hypothetical protein
VVRHDLPQLRETLLISYISYNIWKGENCPKDAKVTKRVLAESQYYVIVDTVLC